MTGNQIAYWNYKETGRHNKESEVIGHRQADAAMSQAAASHRMAAVQEEANKIKWAETEIKRREQRSQEWFRDAQIDNQRAKTQSDIQLNESNINRNEWRNYNETVSTWGGLINNFMRTIGSAAQAVAESEFSY